MEDQRRETRHAVAPRERTPRRSKVAASVLMTLALAACGFDLDPTVPSSEPVTAAPSATPRATASPDATTTPDPSPEATTEPSPADDPPLSLEAPETTDERAVAVEVAPDLGPDGGTITVTVTSLADSRIDEIVLRWPSELDETLFLAPFVPSGERIREGGPPLVQPWTKWVVGPGEQGEPDGTISFGYGPLLAGATLEIPIFVTRRADGPVAFDLQALAGNDLLSFEDGEPAELRVEVP